jgi:hypothetical protein
LSVTVGNVRAVNEARKRRQVKRARREARRRATHHRQTPDESPLLLEVRKALDNGDPLEMLGLVSVLIEVATPDRLDDLVTDFIGVQIRETTALLAVLGELLVDDEGMQRRCRQEVALRADLLPAWISGLPRTHVRRAVRKAHVLGDSDELLIGARLVDGHELTCVVRLDHTILDDVKDAFVVRDSIDTVLAAAVESNTDPDISFTAMTLADARAWIQTALGRTVVPIPSQSRPLVRWLIGRMPEGGHCYERPCDDWQTTSRLLDAFFASPRGRQFSRIGHDELMGELLEAGSGDPLRWSAARIEQALGGLSYHDDYMSVECLLDAPDLLRAFVPVAHALSAIREELTARALDLIDQMEPEFQRRILAEAKRWDDDDDEAWAV